MGRKRRGAENSSLGRRDGDVRGRGTDPKNLKREREER